MTQHGPMAIPRLCVYAERHTVKYVWQVLFKHMEEGGSTVSRRSSLTWSSLDHPLATLFALA